MNKFINESKRIFSPDYTLILIIAGLFAYSIAGIYLSSPLLNQLDAKDLIIKQIMWFSIGSITVIALLKIGIDRLFSFAYVLYWILMALLAFLLLVKFARINVPFARPVYDTYAWYQIPFLGSFQPSEFMKIVLVIISANIIKEHNAGKTEINLSSDFQLIFKIAKYALPAILFILPQPDTGIPIVIIISLATMFFLSGVRKEWFIVIGTLAIGLLLLIVWLYYNNQDVLNSLLGGSSGSYKLDRFYGWLDYEKYSQDQGYQLYNALLSLGTAGWTGHPLQQVIAQYPEAQTDFIFAVIAQNFGFVGALSLILLSFLLDYKLLKIALDSDLDRERYMLIGVVGMLVFQHLENIGMILGILPITGITLPFVSYGGSSTLSYMIPISVALYMHSETKNSHVH